MKNLIYASAIEFVTKNAGSNFSSHALEKYLVPEKDKEKPSSINRLYQSLLESAQNVQMSPNVIGKAISGEKGNIKPLGKILYGFSPKHTALNCSDLTESDLLTKILPTLHSQPHPDKRRLWTRYCKTIISASLFFGQYESHKDFYAFIDKCYSNELMRPFLPLLISYEIDGIGFAIACDFLKELGYIQYGKPDTHIKDVFIELGLLNGASKASSKADYLSLRIIDELASINNVTPFAVDKVLWLVCSGNYYMDGIDIGNQKKAFIDHMKERVQKS